MTPRPRGIGRWAFAALGVIALATIAAACTGRPARGPAPYDAPGIDQVAPTTDGEVLYARDCAWCHGARGEGTTFGPDLNGELDGGAYTHYMLSTGRMPIEDPLTFAERGDVRYTDEQIAAIVEVVESFGGTGPPIPSPDLAAGELSTGEALWQANCAACHGMTGIGGALAQGRIAPELDEATAVQIAEAMLVGPGCEPTHPTCGPGSGAMPRFEFTEDEVNDLVAYIDRLQRSQDPGGWSMGRIGPVAEGALGLLVGVGLLVLVVRWIGTRVERRGGER